MLPSFSVKRPFTVIVAVLLVLILGGTSATKMQTSLIPELDLPYVAVLTTYQGASPEEVEQGLTVPIEGALATTSGVDYIASISSENMSMVAIQFVEGTNMDSVMLEMRETLDLYEDYLPEKSGTPMLLKLDMNSLPIAVLTADIEGAERAETSAYVTEEVVPAYESIDGVASVSTMGTVEPQVDVIINQERLDQANAEIAQVVNMASLFSSSSDLASLSSSDLAALMGGDTSVLSAGSDSTPEAYLTRDMIAQVLMAQNFSYPNGYITENGIDFLVRTGDKYKDSADIGETLLISIPEASIEVRLKDVADIAVVDNADSTYTKVNGNDAIVLTMQKQSESSTSDVAHKINAQSKELQEDNSDLRITTLMDQGVYIDTVVDSVTSNLLYGAFLAIIVLLLFLRDWKLTGVIALSIPLSLVVALILMYFAGLSLNLLSLSGLALGVGMLVDNSIVVIENIYRVRGDGGDVKEAAIHGAKQVSGAIVASTLTTCAVFVPFAFATGITKQLFTDLALTVCFSLVASLLVALTFVPMMCSGALKNTSEKPHPLFERFRDWYTGVLEASLKHKAAPLAVIAVLFALTIVVVTQMGTQFFPETDSTQLTSTITFPDESAFDERTAELQKAMDVIEGIDGVDRVGATLSESGSTSTMDMSSLMGGGGNTTSIYVVLDEKRKATSQEISKSIDEACLQEGLEVKSGSGSMDISQLTGSGIEVVIYGEELDELRNVASQVAAKIAEVEGTEEITDGFNQPTREIRVTVDKDKAIKNGLTVQQIYQAVSKLTATTKSSTTLAEAGNDYPVMVTSSNDSDPARADLEALSINSSQTGSDVKLTDVATISDAQGYTSIAHDKQTRCVTVTAAVADGYNVGKVGNAVAEVVNDFDFAKGYHAEISGESESINDAMHDLALVLILAIVFVYLVMVAQFQSFRYPFIIMFTLPLSYIGGILLLAALQMPLSIVAVVGIVILTGIVVNNGIVFVDYVNQMRTFEGMSRHDALIKAGRDRLRPILMTALTTIFAMLTMAMAVGQSAEMSQPMAIVVIGGLTFATALTLIIVPVVYDLFGGKDANEGAKDDGPDGSTGPSEELGVTPEALPASAGYEAIELAPDIGVG